MDIKEARQLYGVRKGSPSNETMKKIRKQARQAEKKLKGSK